MVSKELKRHALPVFALVISLSLVVVVGLALQYRMGSNVVTALFRRSVDVQPKKNGMASVRVRDGAATNEKASVGDATEAGHAANLQFSIDQASQEN